MGDSRTDKNGLVQAAPNLPALAAICAVGSSLPNAPVRPKLSTKLGHRSFRRVFHRVFHQVSTRQQQQWPNHQYLPGRA